MNIVSGILNRELISTNSPLDILWTNPDNQKFTDFILSLGHKLISIDQLYFGVNSPQLLICNNKVSTYQDMQMLSLQFHLPVIVVDHKIKDDIIDNTRMAAFDKFYCSYSIALNQEIYKSWGSKHDRVLNYMINDHKSKEIWNNIIYQTARKMFTV